jgi:hypothetical protein
MASSIGPLKSNNKQMNRIVLYSNERQYKLSFKFITDEPSHEKILSHSSMIIP